MELFKQATEFIEMMYDELKLGDPANRLSEIKKEIDEKNRYTHTSKELEYGAR
ncbi:nitric oxide synthase oxygenase, partial [Nosocomiicoccus sp. HMSC059G07]